MEYYAGIDVSLESSSICVADATGRIVREAKVASEPEALTAWCRGLGFDIARIGLEAGPLSQWLFAGMKQAGLAVELLETRHVRNAFKLMPVKTDRKDARGIAQLIRMGWFRPVHCKSVAAQETRSLLGARKLLQSKLHDIELGLRGTLRGFGLKLGKTTPKTFDSRVRALVADHPTLLAVADALLRARAALAEQFIKLDKQLHSVARGDNAGSAANDSPRGGIDRGADLRIGDRRSGAVQVLEDGRGTIRPDAKEISVRRDRCERTDLEDWRRRSSHSAV